MPEAATAARRSAALSRVAEAVEGMTDELGPAFQEELDRLEAARLRFAAGAPGAAVALRNRAHDLKGTGKICGFPLAARIAASLQELLDRAPAPPPERLRPLADAHAAAIRTLVREGIREPDHPAGAELAAVLERAAQA